MLITLIRWFLSDEGNNTITTNNDTSRAFKKRIPFPQSVVEENIGEEEHRGKYYLIY